MTSDLIEFSITDETYKKLLDLKNKTTSGNKNWDDFFNKIFPMISLDTKNNTELEKIMESYFYDNYYDMWVQNFALNLNDIWIESSAKKLALDKISISKSKISAIVIGLGPSIKEKKHLQLLADSTFDGVIICTDGALINTLKSGVTPEKFPNFFVVTVDAAEIISSLYDDPIVDKYGKMIKGIFTTVSHPKTLQRARKAKIEIYWLHALFDYGDGKKSFNQISALMTRSKNHINGLPAIQTGGNVGTSAWFIGWKILKCNLITLIGINHGWTENDPWEKIMSHGNSSSDVNLNKNDPNFEKLFPIIYNPDFDCKCILDPVFQYYSYALKDFISRSPDNVTTINATEGGSIFGPKIHSMKFKEFLDNEKFYK